MTDSSDDSGYMEGQLLVAMPGLTGSCFEKAVIYLCAHTPDGAMGLIINQLVESIDVKEIFSQLKIELPTPRFSMPVHYGGPVDSARGFVLHTPDYNQKETVVMSEEISLTSNIDILRDIAGGNGPEKAILTLGYAGWSPGQLETEIESNSWLTVPPSRELVFETGDAEKWMKSAAMQGIDLSKLSGDAGHA